MPNLACPSVDALLKERILEHHVYLGAERKLEAMWMTSGTKGAAFKRALHGFVLLRDDQPDFVQPFDISSGYWTGMTLLGYAATLEGQEGLQAQTGHWFEPLVKFHLVKVQDISSVELISQPDFRGGEPCLWLSAENYRYALMCPFSFFETHWHLTLAGYLASPFLPSSLSSGSPFWWPEDAQLLWQQLLNAERVAMMPAVRRDLVMNNTWHFAGRSTASSSRSGLAPVPIDCGPTQGMLPGKRYNDDPGDSSHGANESLLTDAERRRLTKRFRVDDSNRLDQVMKASLTLGEVRTDLTPAEQPTTNEPAPLRSYISQGLADIWDLGEPTPGSTSKKKSKASH
ncbi:hypothetical protein FS749_006678 [Ceratobasidium sp. UAMH 11750]|nr:hypothetical protein FS749_006678 [Ceratobasidium sp. UAMH 11750]